MTTVGGLPPSVPSPVGPVGEEKALCAPHHQNAEDLQIVKEEDTPGKQSSDLSGNPPRPLPRAVGQLPSRLAVPECVNEEPVEVAMTASKPAGVVLKDSSKSPSMQEWAFENIPSPIKVRREGNSHDSSPPDLSPPPSPKRMREVAHKEDLQDIEFIAALPRTNFGLPRSQSTF